jgi:hypothetical protein
MPPPGARRQLKTSQQAYQAPSLHARMKGRLNEYDLTPLASDGVTLRGRNTA